MSLQSGENEELREKRCSIVLRTIQHNKEFVLLMVLLMANLLFCPSALCLKGAKSFTFPLPCRCEDHFHLSFGIPNHVFVVWSLSAAPPLIAVSPAVLSVIEDQQVTLPCVLLAGNPLPERQWLHNYGLVRKDTSADLSSLIKWAYQ